MKSFFVKLLAAKGMKIASFALATLVALTGGSASGYYIYGASNSNAQEVKEEPVIEVKEIDIPHVEIVEEEEEAYVSNKLYLSTASIDKDLKVTVIDDTGFAVTGYPFEIYVDTYDEGKDADYLAEVARQESLKTERQGGLMGPEYDENVEAAVSVDFTGDKYVDEDEDGIISISDIKAGEYKVVLGSVSGFDTSGALQVSEVKGAIEYKVVDVTSQVKKESQVNAAIEDTAKKNVADEGGVPDVSDMLEKNKNENAAGPVVAQVSASSVNKDLLSKLSPAAATGSSSTATATKKVAKAAPVETPSNNDNTGSSTQGDGTGSSTQGDGTGSTTQGDNTGSSAQEDGTSSPTQGDGTNEGGSTPEGSSESASRAKILSLFRVGTAAVEYDIFTATATIPGTMTLYTNSATSGSNAGTLSLTIDDKDSILFKDNISWSSSNSNVAAIAASGTSAKVTAKGAGTADIKAVIPYNDGEKDTSIEVVCKVSVGTIALDEKLTDTNGDVLYLDENLEKVATLGDYSSDATYYKEDTTGTTISVKSGSIGIDVSKWNGSINWNAVASSGVSFAIIRCGYRGSSTGALVEDPTFAANIQGAKAAGLKVGIYFFTQAVNEAEAVEEASMAVSMARRYGINMPIYIDTEGSGGRADPLSKAERTACIKAFLRTVSSAGYGSGVYASKSWYYDKLNAGELSGNIWVAQYAAACNYTGRYNMWQYTSKGSVPGISGNVDMDIYY